MSAQRLSFRAKLVLSFALASLVPLTVILLITSSLVRSRFRDDAKGRVAQAGSVLERQLASDGRELVAKLDEMSRDFELSELIYTWQAASPASRATAQQDIIDWLAQARHERAITLLRLSTEAGVLVASGHEPGHFGVADPQAVLLAERHPRSAVLVQQSGLSRRFRGLALTAAFPFGESGPRLVLTGGELVDREFVRQRLVTEPDELVLITPDGDVLTSATDNRVQEILSDPMISEQQRVESELIKAGYLVERVSLDKPETLASVRIYLATSSEPLNADLRKLNLAFLTLVAGGSLLAWLSGVVVARPVSLQIDRLVEALSRVAAGDMDARVSVSRDDELGQVARAFNTMTRDLAENKEKLLSAERVAAWREIARRLAHEIKNPLSPILLSIETLRKSYRAGRDDFGEIMEESTATIIEEVQRLKQIVGAFSDFARLPKPRMVEEDMHEAIASVLSLHSGLDARYRFTTDLDPGSARLVFDLGMLNRVLVNLVKNAIEAMPEGGEIHVRTRRLRDRFRVTVADTGPGLDAEARSRLFEPYVTTKPGGTGLGLAIAAGILREHSGRLSVDESWRRGAAFAFELPLATGSRVVAAKTAT